MAIVLLTPLLDEMLRLGYRIEQIPIQTVRFSVPMKRSMKGFS
ncbi:MAG: hypothetical protein SNJ59_10590 [Aggregatilineales bacterium]